MVYDWANSAFFTVVVGVLIGPYLLNLAQNAVGEDGVILDLLVFKVTPKGLPAFCTAVSVISMVIFLPGARGYRRLHAFEEVDDGGLLLRGCHRRSSAVFRHRVVHRMRDPLHHLGNMSLPRRMFFTTHS